MSYNVAIGLKLCRILKGHWASASLCSLWHQIMINHLKQGGSKRGFQEGAGYPQFSEQQKLVHFQQNTIKVCNSCSRQVPGTFVSRAAHLMVSLDLCTFGRIISVQICQNTFSLHLVKQRYEPFQFLAYFTSILHSKVHQSL